MKDVYFERDWDEATTINHQLSHAGDGVTDQHIIDLNRFCDCCDDDEGYDVPKERMKALRAVGLVEGGHRGYYSTTEKGRTIYEQYFIVNRTQPTDGARNDE